MHVAFGVLLAVFLLRKRPSKNGISAYCFGAMRSIYTGIVLVPNREGR